MTRPAHVGRRRRAAAVVLALLAALATACTGTNQETEMDPRAELLARPSSEQAVQRYQEMQRRIQADIDAVIGPRTWTVTDQPSAESCGGGRFADQRDAETVALPRSVFTGAITDEQWPRVEQAINAALRDYGFSTEGLVVRNTNGIRDINAIDRATGGLFTFRSDKNTLVRMTTGCHLPQARKSGS